MLTSVTALGCEVHNLSKAEARNTQLIIAGVIVISGVLLVGFGSIGAGSTGNSGGTKKCPRCAEPIKREAVVCRFCNHEFSSDGSSDEDALNSSREVEPISIKSGKKEAYVPEGFWKCSKCGEVHGNEFDACWSCGSERA